MSKFRGATNWLNQRAGVVLIFMALITGTMYSIQVYEARETAGCQAKYNAAFNVQLTERSRLSSASDAAKNELLLGVGALFLLSPTEDPKEQERRNKQFLQYFRDFRDTSDKIAQDRAATPLPPIPDC